jgi:peroxiredoxin
MRAQRRLGRGVAGLVAFALGLLGGVASADPVPEPLRIGRTIPEFEATTLGGQSLSLKSALEGHKALVVLFLSTMCPYARYFASHLRELDERYGPRGVLFVGVNPNRWESKAELAEYARQSGYTFPIIKDDSGAIAALLGASATPEAFLVDSEGKLRYRGWVKSRQEAPDLQRAIDDVLEGRPVRRPQTKAFGCAVDRD